MSRIIGTHADRCLLLPRSVFDINYSNNKALDVCSQFQLWVFPLQTAFRVKWLYMKMKRAVYGRKASNCEAE